MAHLRSDQQRLVEVIKDQLEYFLAFILVDQHTYKVVMDLLQLVDKIVEEHKKGKPSEVPYFEKESV